MQFTLDELKQLKSMMEWYIEEHGYTPLREVDELALLEKVKSEIAKGE